MEHETLTCPLCGAPCREIIPAGTVQMKCKYCGGAILVPPYFGGTVQRCPNHPDILAVGLCNDCGRSYCDNCLYLYNVEHGTLHLCPGCFKARETDKATVALIFGGLVLLAGLFFMATMSGYPEAIVAGFFFIVAALPSIVWGIYRTTHLPQAVSVKERNEAIQREREFRERFGAKASVSELYSRLLNDHLRSYDPKIAYDILERRITIYMLAGNTRREAVRKLAEEKGYLSSEE